MQRSPSRIRLASGLLALLILAACSNDRSTEPSRPMRTPSESSRDLDPTNSQYLVLSSSAGFSGDFSSVVTGLGGKVESIHQGAGFAVVSGLSAAAAANLGRTIGVSDVQADALVSLDARRNNVEATAAMPDLTATSASNPATAILFSWQWNMRAIKANAAWAANKLGDPSVTVAILDSGMDYDNPDLTGLVDLTRSTSFITSDNQIRAQFFSNRHNISDFNGHGTNVAAIVSSKAFAFAGVTSKTTLIGVKVIGQNGTGPFSAALNGLLWAADHGADVANMSLGGTFTKQGAGRLTSLLNRIFNYANKQGTLVVVAAGNHSEDLDHNGAETNAFCDMVHVVCVSATGPETATGPVDLPAFYTAFGRSAISVAGPGGNAGANFPISAWPWGNDFASWIWSFCSKTSIASFNANGTPILSSCFLGNRLSGYIGTSQASPHVAGLAALLVSLNGKHKPNQIKHLIETSADDAGQPGTDPFFGRGRINVGKAIGF